MSSAQDAGSAAQQRERVEALRSARFRRSVWLSGIAHAVVIALALVSASRDESLVLPGVVTVELVALPVTEAAPAPPAPAPVVPKPEAPAAPTPPPEPRKPVVLPRTPMQSPERKKPPKPRPRARPDPPPEPPDTPVEYDDLMASLRAERGESRPEAEQRPERSTAVRGGGGSPVSPEVAAWIRRARIHVRRAWVLPAELRDRVLETEVRAKLAADGSLSGAPRVARSSGDPYFDESVVRAVQKASPLPPPPEAGEWSFVFRPEDWR